MKKIILLLFASILFYACSEKKANDSVLKEPNQNGYTVIKSENIELVKKFNEKAFALDTAAVRAAYSSENDTIHDNINKINVNENVQLLGKLKSSNVKFTIKNYGALWETINDEANPKGVRNFVIAYIVLNVSNSKTNKDILFHQVCAVKDGKIVEEWDVYDSKILDELLK